MNGYGESYYRDDTGMDYHDEAEWLPLFERFADRIVSDFAPRTVLDIGCAFGYMVKYLRERGVEAWGIDTSKYAITQADESIQTYLRVASGCEALPEDMPQQYDLVLNIEVAEHLSAEDGERLITKLCSYANTVLFSSTGGDIDNPSHINVQQPEYWAQLFAKQGFYKNLHYDMSYLSKYAAQYEQRDISCPAIVNNYERALRYEHYCYEKEQQTSGRLASDLETVREQRSSDESYFREEIERLTCEVKDHINELKNKSAENYQISLELNELKERFVLKEQEITAQITENNRLTFQSNELEQLLDQKQYELTTKNAENTELKEQLRKIKIQTEQLLAQLNQKDLERDSLYEQIEKKEAAAAALSEQMISMTSAKDELQEKCNVLLHDAESARFMFQSITQSRGYLLLSKYYCIRDWLLPKGSWRRNCAKKIANFLIPKKQRSLPPLVEKVESEQQSLYSEEELARQTWCRLHPLEGSVKFSIIVPVYNTPIPVLQAMIFSVKDQIYPNWELCIVDASPEREEIRFLVEQLSADCDKIKYMKLEQNKGISANTTEALKMASGEFIALLDHDDLIAPNALYEYAALLEKEPDIDFFYSDKDMIDEEGKHRINPLYKPEYSPEIMYSANYLTHFCAIRTTVLQQTAGFDTETDGAQDWDIFLKVMALTSRIRRVDQVLYHWRILSTSVASGVEAKPYALDAQLRALRNYIRLRSWNGDIYFADREKSRIKVDWKFKSEPTAAVILFAKDEKEYVIPQGCTEIIRVSPYARDWQRKLETVEADAFIFITGDACLSFSEGLCRELTAWTLHPEIAFAAPQLRADGKIVSCGLVYENGQIMDLFAGHGIGFYGQIGHSEWYRDLSCFRGACVAIERKKFLSFCEYKPELGEFALTCNCFQANMRGLRNVYDPFAWVEVNETKLTSAQVLVYDFAAVKQVLPVTEPDPYFNSRCSVDVRRTLPTKADDTKQPVREVLDQYTTDALALASIFDFTQEDLEKNAALLQKGYHGEVKNMVWFLQEFDYVFYAGLYTIFRTTAYLQERHGIRHTFAFIGNTDAHVMMSRIGEGFPELENCSAYRLTSPEEMGILPHADAAVCTLWTTAYYLLKFNKVKRKFYFIQDYEPLFYPAGSTYAQTEATYRFGFYGIANTQGLKSVYESEYGGHAVSLDPSVDTNIFYPNAQRQYHNKPFTVFFYGRPGHPRNGFELGVEALKCLKRRMGSRVRIVTAGANYDISLYGLDGVLENLGRLKLEETGDLYRNCDVGLVMMYTRHPSYLPYEMMACGCCVVSNYNAYTSWFLKNNENAVVCEPSASGIAQAIEKVLLDTDRRKQIGERGAMQILDANPAWDQSLEKVSAFIQNPGC